MPFDAAVLRLGRKMSCAVPGTGNSATPEQIRGNRQSGSREMNADATATMAADELRGKSTVKQTQSQITGAITHHVRTIL
jgi:hypothetical protein